MKPIHALRSFLILAGGSLLVVSAAHAVDGTWNAEAGTWSTPGNWLGSPDPVPGGQSSTVSLTNNISAGRIVTIDTTSRTVGTLNIGDSDNTSGFTLASTGSATLTFDYNGGGASIVETGSVTDTLNSTLAVILADNLEVNSAGALTIAGTISETGGARSITKTGDGTLLLSNNSNSYTGITYINAGAITASVVNALGDTAGGTIVSSGAALQISANNATYAAEALTLNGTGISGGGALRKTSGGGSTTWAGLITLASDSRINSDAGTLNLNVTSGNAIEGTNKNITFGGASNIVVSDAINIGSGSITKDGVGTIQLSAANSFTGALNINGGTVELRAVGALADNAVVFGAGSTGTLSVRNNNAVISNLNTDPITPGAAVITNGSIAGGTLTVGNAQNLSGTYAGTIINGSSGTLGLTKAGNGTLTLSGTNGYTGATNISAGALALGVTDCLADTSNVVIDAGALNVGAGLTDTVGTLNCTGTATIALGSGAALVFADSSAVNFGTWAGTLNITGPFVPGDGINPGSIRFGDGTGTGLTSTQLASISAIGWINFSLDVNGYLTATPDGGNTAPTISDITNPPSFPSGGNTGALAFTITDEDVNSVTPSGTSSDITLVPDANITFGGSGANRTVTVTPVSGKSGSATITVTVTDGLLTAQDTFVVTVTPNYLSWAASQVPPVTGGVNGDDDNDGVKNLVEYALVDGGERGVLSGNTITFTKRGAPYGDDLTYIIETSETLAADSWTAEVTHTPAQLGSPISYTFTPSTPVKEFARLKVTTP